MSHIYRAYYAIQGLTSTKGQPTNAIYGFTSMLRKLIKEEQPQFLGVAIDLFGPTVRHAKYQEYKSTRRPMPTDLVEQIPYILQVCEVLCVPVLSSEGYEADDVIGTLARKAVCQGLEVVIVTIDKDMFQLVNDEITILDTRTMLRIGKREVEEKFGVPPEKVIDVLSLMGDSSDNIPGAPGIGEKGARQLIQEYGGLENLLAHRDEVPRKTYRESLQQNEPLILQSRELLAIHESLPIELDLEKLRLCEPDVTAARELFRQLEFTALMEEFAPVRVTAENYGTLESEEAVRALARRLDDKEAAVGMAPRPEASPQEGLTGFAVSPQAGEAWFIDAALWGRAPEAVRELFASPSRWVVHDLKPLHSIEGLSDWFPGLRFQDTMLMAYLLNPNQSDFSVERLSLEFLGHKAETAGAGGGDLFREVAAKLLCERADAALQLAQALKPRLEELQLLPVLEEIEIPLVGVLADMEKVGVRVNCDVLREMSREMEGEIEAIGTQIFDIAGGAFNINSPRQLAEILFEKLNLPVSRKTRKAGHYATGVEVLEELAANYDVARLILNYRELCKLKNTYLDALPRLVNPATGRIHTSYNQMVAATGRLSSSNPNLQNIPIRSPLGRKIRTAFVAEPGFKILAADYSQIELRVMAHLSEDPVLLDSFGKDEDIHARTAREVFGMNAVMNPGEFRRHAKVINYGIMYGLSAFGLAQNLKIDRQEAQRFIDAYFVKYRAVKDWIDRTLTEARDKGYVKTLFGRIRPIPEINSKNWSLRSFGERTAVNAPIQGTAADLIKKAMISAHREIASRGLRSKMIMQVHDELVFEVEASEIELMRELVRKNMEEAAPLAVPLEVDLAVGDSWLEAK
jgi:DNA polymerase I